MASALQVYDVYGSKIQDIKQSVVKTFFNIFLTVKTEWANVWTPKTHFYDFKFYTILDKKIVVHSKPFIKIIFILLLIVKCSDQTIIQTIRKKKSILMFLINPKEVSKIIATSKMKVFVVLLVVAFSHQPTLKRTPC